jgi:hypothetical protein
VAGAWLAVRFGAIGAVLGIGYGVALRAWMRLVAEDPSFTWTGTIYIVLAFATLGLMAGLASAGRQLGWTRRTFATRVVGIVLSLGCFGAAGILMLPTIVPAALGWGRHDWWRPVRGALVVLGAAAAVPIILTAPDLHDGRRGVGLVVYLILCPIEVLLMARLYAPNLRRGAVLRWRREQRSLVTTASSDGPS